ncbi:MAG TPA: YbhB/YbcL family Raf kinase inhibitor-like protein [Vicinamibacterales bacterium]|nr:YbhB/YbcL family Raf kinase inhibitor-like protein [Vicinamibacterales bacterium]
MAFTLTSPAFADGAFIPVRYTCDGENLSPPLQWADPPSGTRSFVLIVDDPDAPAGTFTHWVLFDLPGAERHLPEAPPQKTAGRSGRNDFGKQGYGGPCPPRGHGPHRYFFRLSALDVDSLKLAAGARRSEVEAAMKGHVLGAAQLMGRYERR